MAQQINAYCRRHQLIFVETGSQRGEVVLWFVRYDGQRVCLPAQRVVAPDETA